MNRISALLLLSTLLIVPSARAQDPLPPLQLKWVGLTTQDHVGNQAAPVGNGINDLAIVVDPTSFAAGSPVQWSIAANGALARGMSWEWPTTAQQGSAIHIQQGKDGLELFFEPFLTVAGDLFRVTATFGDGSTQTGLVAGSGIPWGNDVHWIGQTKLDLVGRVAQPNGCNDWAIDVGVSELKGKNIAAWRIWLDYAGSDDYFHDTWAWKRDGETGLKPISPKQTGSNWRLFFDPALAREGDQFCIEAILDGGGIMAWTLAGGGTDWGKTAIYYGRGEEDRISENGAEPNGINDIRIEVYDPGITGTGVKHVVAAAAGKEWEWPAGNAEARPGARFLQVSPQSNAVTLTLDNSDDRAGEFYFVCAVLTSGRMIGWAVMTSRTNNSTDADWLGQIEDRVGVNNSPDPDGDLDLAVKVRSPLLGSAQIVSWEVDGGGRYWGPQVAGKASASNVLAVDGNGPTEKVVYFSEGAGSEHYAIARGTKFTIRATLVDGNIINWRLASSGSPTLGALNWEKPTKGQWNISMENPGLQLSTVEVRDEPHTHVWRSSAVDGTVAADASVVQDSRKVMIRLNRGEAVPAPGTIMRIQGTDSQGVRYYGICFVGSSL